MQQEENIVTRNTIHQWSLPGDVKVEDLVLYIANANGGIYGTHVAGVFLEKIACEKYVKQYNTRQDTWLAATVIGKWDDVMYGRESILKCGCYVSGYKNQHVTSPEYEFPKTFQCRRNKQEIDK